MKRVLLSLALVLALVLCLTPAAEAAEVSGSCGVSANWTLNQDTGVLHITGSGAMKDNSSSNGSPWYAYRSTITKIIIDSGITEIGNRSFYDCTNLVEVTIPWGVTRVGDYAFYNANKLPSVKLPGSVTGIGDYAFYDSEKLTTVTMSDAVSSIGAGAFEQCDTLANITMPKSLRTLGAHAFEHCDALKNVQFYDGLQTIGASAFEGADGLVTVMMPDSVATIGKYAFYSCDKLVSVQLSNKLEELPYQAFYACKSLKYITMPNNLRTIGSDCFYDCTSLTGIKLPGNLLTIKDDAFRNTNLAQIVIPASVTSVGAGAFRSCDNLQKVAVLNDTCSINDGKTCLGVIGVTTIYARSDSNAYNYALKYGYGFQYLTSSNLWTDVTGPMEDVVMISATGHATGNIVYWDAIDGATLYQVYRLKSGEKSWTLLKNTGGTGYKDTTAPAGVRCYYKVRARFGSLMSSLNISSVSTVRPSAGLANVTITRVLGHNSGNIVYWNAVSGAKLYQVYRLESGSSSWTLLKNTGGTAYKDELAKVGIPSYYKIVARNGDMKSDIATTAAVSAVRLAPVSLSNVTMLGAQGHSTGIIVTWNPVGGASLYQVYRLQSGASSWTLLTNTGGTAFKDTSAVSGVRYYYKVVARYGSLRSSMDITPVSAVRP